MCGSIVTRALPSELRAPRAAHWAQPSILDTRITGLKNIQQKKMCVINISVIILPPNNVRSELNERDYNEPLGDMNFRNYCSLLQITIKMQYGVFRMLFGFFLFSFVFST